MSRSRLVSVLPLSLPLSACTAEMGVTATVLLLVLLPAALVFALLWGLRTRRRLRVHGKEDRRNYPDYDDKE
ncbi:hypothetical protein [Sulfurivermis fontis]|jgi:hypothetical protein|uniref:hypothetical protein n=1 Tax=Sulfurivermis fontis TaxID=1972068 RepID=UPI000FD9EAE3|nr:hypothetical protein [Sulfurivermis fontis]